MRMIKWTAAGLLLCSQVYAAQTTHFSFNLPAQPLENQISAITQTTGILLSVDAALLDGRSAPSIKGDLSSIGALNKALSGSGLSAIQNNDLSYTIIRNQPLPGFQDSSTVSMDSILVTGEKLERSLKDTHSAVSVIGQNSLNNVLYPDASKALESVPNVIEHPFGTPNIRGVEGAGAAQGVFSFISGGRPRISTTIDGLAETWTGVRYINTGLWDAKQIEVLRGPQSTSQGRNAMGGAVVVSTNDPTFDWDNRIRVGWENEQEKYQTAAVLSGPIIEDELAFRIAAERLSGHSFIDYQLDEGAWSDDPDKSTQQSVRAKLLWEPANLPELSAKLSVSQREADGEYLNYVDYDGAKDFRFTGDDNNTRLQDSSETAVNLNISYQLSDSLNAHVLLGHQRYRSKFVQSPNPFYMDLEEDSTTLEARLNYRPMDSNFSGMLGVYSYEKEEDILIYDGGFNGTDEIRTMAVFGEAQYRITPNLELIAGGRLEREHQKRDIVAWPDTAWEGLVELDHAKTLFLPKIGAAYYHSDNANTSFTIRKGYNAGGGALDWITSEFYTYNEERVTTYELNHRTTLLNERLMLSGSLFYNDYDGYLAYVMPRFTNFTSAYSYGVELEAIYQATEQLRVNTALGLLKTKISDAEAGFTELEGNEFGYAPDVTAHLGAEYQISDQWSVSGDIHHVSGYYSDASNSEETKLDGYTILSANSQYWITPDLKLGAYVKNLTNEQVIYRITSQGQANVGAPRTLGVSLDYFF
jgi:iron complex outermembrane receptor protein